MQPAVHYQFCEHDEVTSLSHTVLRKDPALVRRAMQGVKRLLAALEDLSCEHDGSPPAWDSARFADPTPSLKAIADPTTETKSADGPVGGSEPQHGLITLDDIPDHIAADLRIWNSYNHGPNTERVLEGWKDGLPKWWTGAQKCMVLVGFQTREDQSVCCSMTWKLAGVVNWNLDVTRCTFRWTVPYEFVLKAMTLYKRVVKLAACEPASSQVNTVRLVTRIQRVPS